MARIMVDNNIFSDVMNPNPGWFAWSSSQLRSATNAGLAAINPIIYAELAVAFGDRHALDLILDPTGVVRLDFPYDAAWLAGRAFAEYRRRGGPRTSPMSDFYIGAHAAAAGLTVLTRDVARYRTNFPGVPLIHP